MLSLEIRAPSNEAKKKPTALKRLEYNYCYLKKGPIDYSLCDVVDSTLLARGIDNKLTAPPRQSPPDAWLSDAGIYSNKVIILQIIRESNKELRGMTKVKRGEK
jgi:hypothetical protein